MKYTRLFADSDGETHFEDVEVEFQQTEYVTGVPPLGLSIPTPATDTLFVQFNPGLSSDYHSAPRRELFIVLTGELEAVTSDGEVRRFGPGDGGILDDVDSKGHIANVISQAECVVVSVRLAE